MFPLESHLAPVTCNCEMDRMDEFKDFLTKEDWDQECSKHVSVCVEREKLFILL